MCATQKDREPFRRNDASDDPSKQKILRLVEELKLTEIKKGGEVAATT